MATDCEAVQPLSACLPPAPLDDPARFGLITFVGVGSGDPMQISLAALEAIRVADDVIIGTDVRQSYVCQPEIRLADEARIWTFADEDIDRVAALAQSGRTVAWLVLGDPLLDGRDLEHMRVIHSHGVKIDLILGRAITGMGLSTAGLTANLPVQFFPTAPLDAVAPESTCIYTTTDDLKIVARYFARREIPKSDPVLVSLDFGTIDQRTLETTVGKLIKADPQDGVVHTAMVVHGPMATREDHLDWYESKPLFGWRVLVPRTKGVSGALERRLENHGAETIQVPTLAVEPPRNTQPIERGIQGLVDGRFQWIIFNSPNAVQAVIERLAELGLDARAFSGLRIAAVGSETIAALRAWGIEPDLIPWGPQDSDSLAAEFPFYDDLLDPINRVFLPRADVAVSSLATQLSELGWDVEDVTAYRTVRAAPPSNDIRTGIKSGYFDAVVFSSVTSVRNMVGIAGKPHPAIIVAAIGPATAAECEEQGIRVDVLSPEPDAVPLADALAAFAADRRAQQIADGQPVKRPSQRRARRRPNST